MLKQKGYFCFNITSTKVHYAMKKGGVGGSDRDDSGNDISTVHEKGISVFSYS